MAKRILLAGVLGGLALFFWGGFSHMVLGLGELGVRPLPQAQGPVDALKAAVPKAGFYFFPPVDEHGKMRPEDVGGPNGIVIYHPAGASAAIGPMLASEAIVNIVQALLAAILLLLVPGLRGYVVRAGFVVLAGLLGAAAMTLEYWIWFGFPTKYTVGFLADRAIGFLILGLVVAAFVKPAKAEVQRMTTRAA